MHHLSGGCHCGQLRVEVQLTGTPASYNPRACDCDFCRKHGAAYLSDPRGTLIIRIADRHAAGRYRQGSGLAELLFCRHCGVAIGALYRSEQRLYGVVNANVLDAAAGFGAEHSVSPQRLSADQKVSRWRELWFADVLILTPASPPVAGGSRPETYPRRSESH
jgi:hypothetical protein